METEGKGRPRRVTLPLCKFDTYNYPSLFPCFISRLKTLGEATSHDAVGQGPLMCPLSQHAFFFRRLHSTSLHSALLPSVASRLSHPEHDPGAPHACRCGCTAFSIAGNLYSSIGAHAVARVTAARAFCCRQRCTHVPPARA